MCSSKLLVNNWLSKCKISGNSIKKKLNLSKEKNIISKICKFSYW